MKIRDAHGHPVYKAEGAGSVRLENNTIEGRHGWKLTIVCNHPCAMMSNGVVDIT